MARLRPERETRHAGLGADPAGSQLQSILRPLPPAVGRLLTHSKRLETGINSHLTTMGLIAPTEAAHGRRRRALYLGGLPEVERSRLWERYSGILRNLRS